MVSATAGWQVQVQRWHGLAMQLVVADAEGKLGAYDQQLKTTQVITATWHDH